MRNELLVVESSFHLWAWKLKFTEMTKGYAIGQSSFGRLWGQVCSTKESKNVSKVVLQSPAP